MVRAKYIITFFLFLTAFLFIGESYTFFLENFQNSYTQVGYYLQAGDSEKKMNHKILKQAEDFNTPVFAMKKTSDGAFARSIIIYGDKQIAEVLKEDWNIKQGTVKSFFSGNTSFTFEPFENADEKAMQNCWYPEKTADELFSMVYPGMIHYSGAFRNDPVSSTSRFVVAGAWFVGLFAVLLITAYSVSYEKKEQLIRIILGADNKRLKWQKNISDILGLSISAIAAFVLLRPFTTPAFELPTTLICFVIILTFNSVLLAWDMRIKKGIPLKETLSNKVLGMSMGLKGIIAATTVVVLSITLALSMEGIKLYSQNDYYENQNSVHVDIAYPYDYQKIEVFTGTADGRPPLDTRSQVHDNFLRYSYQFLDCSLLYSHSYENIAPKYGEKLIYANIRGLEAYQEFIPQWDKLQSNEGNYILISENENQTDVMNELLSFGNVIGLSEDTISGIVPYDNGLSITAEGRRDGEFDYTYRTKNPVIILDTHDYGKLPTYPVTYSLHEPEEIDGVIFHNPYYFMQFISVKNDSSRIDAFAYACASEAISPDLMEFSIENVGEWFNGLWALQNRSLLIAIIMTVLLVVLELQISILVLRIAYETNAKELTIRKILGYSIFERYRNFFILSGGICSLSLIAAFAVSLVFRIGAAQYLIYGSIVVWLLDWIILLLLTQKNDKLQIQKVLKGGA